MSPDQPPIDGTSIPDRTPIDGRSTADNRSTVGLSKTGQPDGRRRLARRAKQLARAFEAELGGALSDAQMVATRRAGEMTAIAEETRSRWLSGDWKTTGTDVVRIDGAARRAILDLGLPTSSVRPAETLEQYLARTGGNAADDQIDNDDQIEGDELAQHEE
jgi:hypothetical protein